MFGWDDLRSWGSFIMAAGAIIYTALTGRSKSNAADIVAIREDLKKHDRRIQSVEDELKHLPTKDEVHQLKLSMEQLNGTIELLAERIGAQGKILSVIDESLRREDIKTGAGAK